MKYVLALSGGLDSGVLAHSLLNDGHGLLLVNFQYPSRHGPHEQEAARRLWLELSSWYGAHLAGIQIPMHSIFSRLDSALLANGPDLPVGHYEEETMRQTVVPGRNLIFAATLAALAESKGYDFVTLGVHAGDHFIYPDCRPKFVCSLSDTVEASSDGKVRVVTPFINMTKKEIVERGLALTFPFHLTRTCYTSNALACGRCGSCQERLEAFALCEATDPLDYESRDLIPKTEHGDN